ncbi:MAG: hypothetical protein EOP22_11990 [Hyphomicrobiales bacterium]|nr:MAG: hypothetical protein EOP22_11990 [Hyphomicrobiales bacterium]
MNRLKLPLAALALAPLLLPAPAAAEASLAAYGAVREGLLAVWDELPLTVEAATLSDGPATGFGQFTPRSSREFAPGETVNVYAELIGYGASETADGYYLRQLDADLTLLDAAGNVRASQPAFFTSSTKTRQRLLETWLSFTVTLSDFEPGEYRLHYVVHDRAGEKQTSFELPITLTPAPPAGG